MLASSKNDAMRTGLGRASLAEPLERGSTLGVICGRLTRGVGKVAVRRAGGRVA
jgi:hypothetical protein